MKSSQLVVMLGISAVVAGCVGPVKDTFEDRAVDYKSSYSLDPIQFPEQYDLAPPLEAFPIEGVDQAVAGTGGSRFTVPEVPAQDPSLQQTQTRVLASERVAFLRVDSSPSEIWPELTAFLESTASVSSQIVIVRVSTRDGWRALILAEPTAICWVFTVPVMAGGALTWM